MTNFTGKTWCRLINQIPRLALHVKMDRLPNLSYPLKGKKQSLRFFLVCNVTCVHIHIIWGSSLKYKYHLNTVAVYPINFKGNCTSSTTIMPLSHIYSLLTVIFSPLESSDPQRICLWPLQKLFNTNFPWEIHFFLWINSNAKQSL